MICKKCGKNCESFIAIEATEKDQVENTSKRIALFSFEMCENCAKEFIENFKDEFKDKIFNIEEGE